MRGCKSEVNRAPFLLCPSHRPRANAVRIRVPRVPRRASPPTLRRFRDGAGQVLSVDWRVMRQGQCSRLRCSRSPFVGTTSGTVHAAPRLLSRKGNARSSSASRRNRALSPPSEYESQNASSIRQVSRLTPAETRSGAAVIPQNCRRILSGVRSDGATGKQMMT